MNYKLLAKQTEDYIIKKRRFYHSIPELSWQEKETTKAIIKDLEELGLKARLFEGVQGCTAEIVGDKKGKIVALRADIDALPIKEETELSFAADNGNMHACGHDAHIAMLLGAAKMLVETKENLAGTVRLIFQPAEETASGAVEIIKQGVMDDVDAVYSSHIWGNFDAPGISVEAGNRMAAPAYFDIEVEGVAAHGSAPNLGVDAIVAASGIIQALQTYVSRINDPLNPLVLTIGTIHGGSRYNVIANNVKMDGTIRTFSKETIEKSESILRNIILNTAAAYGAKAKFNIKWLTSPVINDKQEVLQIAKDAAIKLYGEESLTHLDTLMGSEDFSEYMAKADGVFTFLGSRNKEKGIFYTNHHEKYTVDEDVLKRGSALYAQFAFDFLNK